MPKLGGSAFAEFTILFALFYGAFGAKSPFFPSFLNARGLEPEAIGIALAVGTATGLITGPLVGQIADRLDASRALLAVSLASAALVTWGYVSVWGFWPLLLINVVAAVTLAPIAPIADALALGAAERRNATGRPAFDYGWVRGAGSAAFIAGSLLSGQFVGQFGLTAIMIVQAGLLAVASLVAIRVPQGPWPAADQEGTRSPPLPGRRQGVRRLLAIPLYRNVVLVAGLVFGSHAMHDSFAVIRWREAGIGPELIGLLWSESVAAEVVVFFFIGRRLLDSLGPARTAALCVGAGALRWTVMSQTASIPALMLVQPLHGLTFALLHLTCMRVLSHTVPRGLEATGLTLYGTLGPGLSSVLLTLASGPLYGRLGTTGFLAMAGLCAAALPVALKLKLPPNTQNS